MEIYSTTVLNTKRIDFFNFLEDLGISKEDLKLTHIRGDYFFYELNLPDNDIDDIRSKLNYHQVDFL